MDDAIDKFVDELKKEGLYESTLIIITAKHGQSPVDSPRYTGIAPTILKALGLDPNDLQAVQKEHTQVLPGVPLN